MHQVVVEVEKTSVEAAAGHEQKKMLLQEGAEPPAVEKWLERILVLIRWAVRVILIHTWASYLHHDFKLLAPSLPALSASFASFSLLLYACSLLYLRFARHALASLSFNRAFAVFNLSWAIVLLSIGLTSTSLGLVAAEDVNTLSVFSFPHAVIAHLFIHLLTTAAQRLRPLESKVEAPPKRASCSTICSLVLQIFLLLLWILYPIAHIHDLNSPFVFILSIISTLIAIVTFIVFFCTAIALVFLQHEEIPMLV